MEEKQSVRNHKISLNNRGAGIITGVNDVLSFDANEILLETDQGALLIKGKDLHVTRLTVEKGEVEIDGTVDSFAYSDLGDGHRGQESIFSRLFK